MLKQIFPQAFCIQKSAERKSKFLWVPLLSNSIATMSTDPPVVACISKFFSSMFMAVGTTFANKFSLGLLQFYRIAHNRNLSYSKFPKFSPVFLHFPGIQTTKKKISFPASNSTHPNTSSSSTFREHKNPLKTNT